MDLLWTAHVAHSARCALETLSPRLRIVTLRRRRPGHSRGGCTTGAARFRVALEKRVKRFLALHRSECTVSATRAVGGGGEACRRYVRGVDGGLGACAARKSARGTMRRGQSIR